jgi:hypothetical protein
MDAPWGFFIGAVVTIFFRQMAGVFDEICQFDISGLHTVNLWV